MYSSERNIFSLLPSKQSQHFPDDEYIQICQLVMDKINDFKETFAKTQFATIVSEKISEISDVIINHVKYPKELFEIEELFNGCEILLLSNEFLMIKKTISFLSLIVYNTDNFSEYISELFPIIFTITESSSDTFIKAYFSLLTNIFTDLKNNNNFSLINDILSQYIQSLISYISNLDNIYKEELIFLMVISSLILSENDAEIYSQFTLYLFDFLNDSRILSDEEYLSVVIWSIYENCKHNTAAFEEIALSEGILKKFIECISDFDSFPTCCLEPILIVLYLCIESQEDLSFISKDDIPIFLYYCSSHNSYVQYDAIRLVRSIIQFFPSDCLSLNVQEIINIFGEVQFKSAKEIFLIACSLIIYMPYSYLVSNYSDAEQIILFVIQNINLDNESSIFALHSLIKMKENLTKLDNLQNFYQFLEESDQFNELRESNFDEILELIENFDLS